jgi:myo-inositol 2-dehydrogenase / D-chiro-inositol 1-dehydrogenase
MGKLNLGVPVSKSGDPKTEMFKNNNDANAMLSRPQRYPYGTNNIKGIKL